MPGARSRTLRPVWWEDEALAYVDQRALPRDLVHARATDPASVLEAIERGAIAGSGCIDIACAFGVALARRAASTAATTEPCAASTIAQLRAAADENGENSAAFQAVLEAPPGAELDAALSMLAGRRRIDESIARNALALLPARSAVLTFGNSGAFATGTAGTALGAIIAAHRSGKAPDVFLSESGPAKPGLRLGAFECAAAGIPSTVFPDGDGAALMLDVPIAAVIIGAYAMSAGGDIIAQSGTYGLAVAAAHHRIPFFVALARAAIEFAEPGVTGGRFSRRAAEIRAARSARRVDAPASAVPEDVTPGHLISAIVTEYGISRPPYFESLPSLATRPLFEFVGPT